MAEEQALTVVKSEPLPALTVVQSEPEAASVPNAALWMSAAGASAPLAERLALEAATNPNIPRVFATAGRVAGGMAPAIAGAVKLSQGDMMGAAYGLTGAAGGSWAGGRTGWFTGKLAQKLALPVAKVAEAVAPYAQALSTASGAQGVLDLAQMAEPTRKDVGVLGVSFGDKGPNDPNHPPLINSIVDKLTALMKSYTDQGLSKKAALDTALAVVAQPSK